MMDINIFKTYLSKTPSYVGGKSVAEIQTSADQIYKLSSNENALGSSPKAIEAIQKHCTSLSDYPERTDATLRQLLSTHYDDLLAPEQYMVTPSGSEMIDLLARAFLEPGLSAIVSSPCFKPYSMFSENMGAHIVDIRLKDSDFSLDIDRIVQSIDSKTRLLFLASPNNPTGSYIPRNTLDELLSQIPPHIVVVLDEVYQYFADAEDYTTAMDYVAKDYRMIGMTSMSKGYGLAGLRLGYAYGPVDLMQYLRTLWKPFLLSTIHHVAFEGALQDHDFLQCSRAHVISERSRIYARLDELQVAYHPSQGNFILIDPGMPDDVFESRMLEYGVMVRPGSGFDAPGKVRVTIGTTEGNDVFLHGLEEILRES